MQLRFGELVILHCKIVPSGSFLDDVVTEFSTITLTSNKETRVTNNVDETWDATRTVINFVERRWSERNRLFEACDAKALADVHPHFTLAQRPQNCALRDSLP